MCGHHHDNRGRQAGARGFTHTWRKQRGEKIKHHLHFAHCDVALLITAHPCTHVTLLLLFVLNFSLLRMGDQRAQLLVRHWQNCCGNRQQPRRALLSDCAIVSDSYIFFPLFIRPKQRWCFMPSQQSIARHTPFNLWAEMNRGQSASARLGRVSEESAEFFERVNAVLQKQENMLRAAQAEVTPNPPSTFPSARHLTPRLPAGLKRLRLASPAAPGFLRGQ